LERGLEIGLSSSFLEEDRVDDVEYKIVQKPKPVNPDNPDYDTDYCIEEKAMLYGCINTYLIDNPGSTLQEAIMYCYGDYDTVNCYPSLCQFLSKEPDDDPANDHGIGALHQIAQCMDGIDNDQDGYIDYPLDPECAQFGDNDESISGDQMQAWGMLSKLAGDLVDIWTIDLEVPCFIGQCAQGEVGWLPPAWNGAQFGCDLWIEATNISIPPDRALLTVIKHVINDSGTGSNSASDFTMNVTGTNVSDPSFPGAESPGTDVTLDAGSYSVDETGPAGYTKTLGADCSGTIAVGEHKFCTITNDDIAIPEGTLTVIKVVENNGVGTKVAGDFQMTIDGGNVNQNQAYSVSVGNHTVSEVDSFGYVVSFSDDCDSSGVVNVGSGDNKTCTATNTYPAGTLTVHKVVVDDGGIGTKVAGDFQMTIDGGNVAQDTPIPVSVGNHTVSEVDNFGYEVTYSAECPGGVANVPNGGNVTCTVTNTMPYGTITVTKTVTNDDGGDLTIGSFILKIDGVTVTSGVPKNVAVGAHNVSEVGLFGYLATVSGDCNTSGDVTVASGESKNCTITNDDIPPSITLVKNVSGGSALPDDFDVSIDGAVKVSGSSNPVMANTAHEIDEETIVSGYSFTSITGSSFLGVPCPSVLQGTITLLPGDVVTCTITNTYQ